jgi:hypothetical protein
VESFLQKVANRAASLKAAAVDFLADGMTIATAEQQAHRDATCKACPVLASGQCDYSKGGCGCVVALKIKARSAACPLGKWFAYHDYYKPLVNPVRSLIFHVYPLRRRGDWWRWHVDQIRKHAGKFNGKIVIGVVTGPETETIEDVTARFAGIPVVEWIVRNNSPLAETLTHVDMMRAVKTDDPNAIVMRMHCKGVTKQPGAVEEDWARLMWDTLTDLPSVEDALASHLVCGPLRSLDPLVQNKPGPFFFAGSGYWFRAKEAFERDWEHTDATRWFVEYAPSHLFTVAESASLIYDRTESSVIRSEHFRKFIQPEWDLWRQARGIE